MPYLGRRLAAVTAALAMSVTTCALTSPASADSGQADDTKKTPVATGYGGAVSTVDLDASEAAIKLLRRGGNAVDAAVAAAATLGVTEPYSAGIGGGGYFVYYDAETEEVNTIDGRETAPAEMPEDAFINPEDSKPYSFKKQATSGISVGVPGTPATWERALERWGRLSLEDVLKPAITVATRVYGGRDVPPANRGQQGTLCSVRGNKGAVPARRRPSRRRDNLQEPGPGRYVQAPGPSRHGRLLRGQAGRGHRADSPECSFSARNR